MASSRSKKSWRKSIGAAVFGLALVVRGGRRPLVLVVALVAAAVGGAFYARHRWPELLTIGRQHRMSAEAIDVTPQPRWIATDVKAEVIESAGLAELDLLDRELTARVAQAFAAHTWVAEVRRVVKQAGPRVVVELAYRRPVAMVEVVSAGRPGLLPLDEQAVLLPPEDFSPNEARDYLRIQVADSKPAGPVGTPWGDPRITGAVHIAAAWREKPWKSLGLYRIETDAAAPASPARPAPIEYVLQSREGRRILWGRAPGEEQSGEATTSQKIARLIAHVQAGGRLDEPGGDLDLRDAQGLRELPRTARLGKQP
jgi:hypothetical protein